MMHWNRLLMVFGIILLPSQSVMAEDLCKHFAKFVEQGVPRIPLKQALHFYKEKKKKFKKNPNVISIADYSRSSREPRLYVMDLEKGTVGTYKVSHGSGKIGDEYFGDHDDDGMLDSCKVGPEGVEKHKRHSRTNMTRVGFFKTGRMFKSETHIEKDKKGGGKTGWPWVVVGKYNALRLHGLNKGVNGLAYVHGVAFHGDWRNQGEMMSRSYGRYALTPPDSAEVIHKIKKGSLFYSYAPICIEDMEKVYDTIGTWLLMCD